MSKNEIILVTLISLIESGSLTDTVFATNTHDTLFDVLLDQLSVSQELKYKIFDIFQSESEDQFLQLLKELRSFEDAGLLSA